MDRYDSLLTLVSQIAELKVSLAKGEECWKNVSRATTKVCRKF